MMSPLPTTTCSGRKPTTMPSPTDGAMRLASAPSGPSTGQTLIWGEPMKRAEKSDGGRA